MNATAKNEQGQITLAARHFNEPTLTPANFNLCNSQLNILRGMLDQYKKNPAGRAIIYMEETQAHGQDFNSQSLWMAAFQLKIMPTRAGHLQIAIHQCSRGMTGSGAYFNTSEEALECALKHLRYFHRSTPFSDRLKSVPSDYAFRFIAQ